MSDEMGTLDSVLDERRARLTEAADAPADDTGETDAPEPEAPAVDAPEAEGDAPEAEGEAEQEAVAAVDAPHYWPADKKADFARLPADLQALVAEQEQGRVAAVNRAQQQAIEARKHIEAQAAQTSALNDQLGRIANEAQAVHSRVIPELGMSWEEVDWSAWFQQDRATAATFRAQYDAEREEIQRLEAAKNQAESASYRQFLAEESAKLPTLAPDLVGPEGPKRKAELFQFLGAQYPQDIIAKFSATDLSIAYKAMRFDQMQANAQALKSTPQKPPSAARLVRPSAPGGSSTSTRLQELEARVARTGSMDDVLALRKARRKA